MDIKLSDRLRAFCGIYSDYAGSFAQEAVLLETSKDEAYSERNKLVALISKIFPSHLERHPDDDKEWEDAWRWIVFIQLPTGQCSWHIHDSELPLFGHLPQVPGHSWDGHTTEQKYDRIAAY